MIDLERNYHTLFEAIDEGVLALSKEGVIHYCNHRFLDMLGMDLLAPQVIGTRLQNYLAPQEHSRYTEFLQQAQQHPNSSIELQLNEKQGQPRTLRFKATSLLLQSETGFYLVTYDMNGGDKTNHLLRIYTILSQINQAIVRYRNKEELLQQICRIAVQHGNFHLAWVGLLSQANGDIEPYVWHGHNEGYIQSLHINISDAQFARAPAVLALNQGEVIFINQIQSQPDLQPWHERIRSHGYRSLAAIPFGQAANQPGILIVYSTESDFFSDDEKNLLTEIGLDISFALESLANDLQRKKAEERFYKAFQTNPAAIAITRLSDGIILDVNNSYQRIFGFNRAEVIGHTAHELHLFPESVSAQEVLAGLKTSSSTQNYETNLKIKSGEILSFYLSNEILEVNDETCVISTMIDITEQKRNEQSLLQSERCYRLVSENSEDVIWALDLSTQRFSYVSPSVYRLRGLTPEEVIAEPMEKAMTPDSYKSVIEGLPVRLHRFSQGDQSAKILVSEIDQIHKDGSIIPTEVVTTLVPDGTGQVVEIIGVSRDLRERKRIEDTLRSERDRFSKIAATVPGLICSFRLHPDGSSSMPYASPAIDDIYGLKAEDIANDISPLFSRISPLDIDHVNETISQSAVSLTPWQAEYRYQHPQKGEVWLEGFSMPTPEADGSIIWHGVITDITRRKKEEEALQESEERYRLIVENATIGIIVHVNNKIVYGNNAALKMIGGDDQKFLLGRNIFEFIHPEDRPSVINLVQQAFMPRPDETAGVSNVLIEERLIRLDGNIITIEATAVVTSYYGTPALMVMMNDITDRKKAEKAVLQINADLENRVRERTARLQAINAELESFSYSVSHDLRAPLRTINGFSQIILEDHFDQLDEIAQGYFKRISAASKRMEQIIDNLLILSRLTRSDMKIKEIDVSAMAGDVLEELTHTSPNRKVETIITEQIRAYADENLLRIALENLLRNAWKFTAKQPDAQIEIGTLQQDGKNVIYVRDNGAGFDMAFAGKLFGAFQRLHSDTEFEGTGIGLALVQRVINRHGGEIWAESSVGQGATFYFTLPNPAISPSPDEPW